MNHLQWMLFNKTLIVADQEGVCAAIDYLVEEGRSGYQKPENIEVVTRELLKEWRK